MTNAELAILSLVVECPRYGYEIEQIIEARGMRDWTEIGFSSIYYLLNKLEKAFMIESKLQEPEGRGPARKVYTSTSEGQQAHLEGALKALENPQRRSAPFLLGLSNLPMLPRNRVIKALNGYIEQLERRLAHMLQRRDSQQPVQPFVEAMFDYSRTMIQAEIDWLRNIIWEVEVGNV